MKIEVASSLWSRLRGLKAKKNFGGVLMLTPCNDIHTFGMKQKIDVAFITNAGLVLESYREIGKARRLRCKNAACTLERFSQTSPWLERGDRINLKSLEQRKELK